MLVSSCQHCCVPLSLCFVLKQSDRCVVDIRMKADFRHGCGPNQGQQDLGVWKRGSCFQGLLKFYTFLTVFLSCKYNEKSFIITTTHYYVNNVKQPAFSTRKMFFENMILWIINTVCLQGIPLLHQDISSIALYTIACVTYQRKYVIWCDKQTQR